MADKEDAVLIFGFMLAFLGLGFILGCLVFYEKDPTPLFLKISKVCAPAEIEQQGSDVFFRCHNEETWRKLQ